jgi:fructose-1,6-bisphosphatase II
MRAVHVPDTHMDKIAVGRGAGAIDCASRPPRILQTWPTGHAGRRSRPSSWTVQRHADLIKEVRKAGARIKLIRDGDVSAAIATCREDTGIDILLGIGGAREGVIAAAALRCVGGDMQGVLRFRDAGEQARARRMGIQDSDRVYRINELAAGDVMFAATGVTTGDLLDGVRFFRGGASTHSVGCGPDPHDPHIRATHISRPSRSTDRRVADPGSSTLPPVPRAPSRGPPPCPAPSRDPPARPA